MAIQQHRVIYLSILRAPPQGWKDAPMRSSLWFHAHVNGFLNIRSRCSAGKASVHHSAVSGESDGAIEESPVRPLASCVSMLCFICTTSIVDCQCCRTWTVFGLLWEWGKHHKQKQKKQTRKYETIDDIPNDDERLAKLSSTIRDTEAFLHSVVPRVSYGHLHVQPLTAAFRQAIDGDFRFVVWKYLSVTSMPYICIH